MKKDWKIIANSLNEVKSAFIDKKVPEHRYNDGKYDAFLVIASVLSSDIAKSDSHLDRAKFLKACGCPNV